MTRPMELAAGPLRLIFDSGAIRWVAAGPEELVRGIHGTVRDDVWGTVQGDLHDLRVHRRSSSFEVDFRAIHRAGDVDFTWQGRCEGDAEGTIRFQMDGIAGATFRQNRIGLCILHPIALAGQEVAVRSALDDGTWTAMVLPRRVAANDPITAMTGLRWALADGRAAELTFTGGVFELEDQRNWTDASFKTFSPPLALPHPTTIENGTRVQQSVMLRVGPPPQAADRGVVGLGRATRQPVVRVDPQAPVPMPLLGTCLAPGREAPSPDQLTALREVAPAVLRTVVELDASSWTSVLHDGLRTTAAVGARAQVEVIAPEDPALIGLFVEALGASGPAEVELFAFPDEGYASTRTLRGLLVDAIRAARLPVRVGGGSRANFAELNRASADWGSFDLVGFPISAQVHAFDDASVMETLASYPDVIASLRALVGATPVVVGPVTLLPRMNPYGATRQPLGIAQDVARTDPRQDAGFAAAWTLAVTAVLADEGVETVLLHEATGPAGLAGNAVGGAIDRPVGQLMRELATMRRAVRVATSAPPGMTAMAFLDGDLIHIQVAGLTAAARDVVVVAGSSRALVEVPAYGIARTELPA